MDGNGNAYIAGDSDDTSGSPIAPFYVIVDGVTSNTVQFQVK